MSNKIILTIAPTGNVPTREMNPNVPLTPREIAAQIYECWKEGAAVCHIHTRDKQGIPTSDVEVNREVLAELDKYPECDIIRQLSTGGRAGKNYMERGQMLCLAPEMASLATGSSNFPARVNVWSAAYWQEKTHVCFSSPLFDPRRRRGLSSGRPSSRHFQNARKHSTSQTPAEGSRGAARSHAQLEERAWRAGLTGASILALPE